MSWARGSMLLQQPVCCTLQPLQDAVGHRVWKPGRKPVPDLLDDNRCPDCQRVDDVGCRFVVHADDTVSFGQSYPMAAQNVAHAPMGLFAAYRHRQPGAMGRQLARAFPQNWIGRHHVIQRRQGVVPLRRADMASHQAKGSGSAELPVGGGMETHWQASSHHDQPQQLSKWLPLRHGPAAAPATPPAGSAMPSGARRSSGGHCAPDWRRSVGSRPDGERPRPVSGPWPCENPAAAWGAVRESGRGSPVKGGDQACTGLRLYFKNTYCSLYS